MKRHALLLISTFGLLTALFLAAGCVTITVPQKTTPPGTSPPATAPKAEGDLPIIISFAASPETAAVGQAVTLSWNVSDATSVSIQPAVGTVNTSGMQMVLPARTTSYTLTASNAAGSAMRSLTVTVTATVALPDLVVTEVADPGAIVYYKIKNLGGAAIRGSQSYLYINDVQVSTDYIEPLAPGEERLESFSNYTAGLIRPSTTPGYESPTAEYVASMTQTIKVCTDAENAIVEANEGNNCTTVFWGPGYTYDFVKNAHQALWRSGFGELTWPMVGGDTRGAAFINHQPLEDGRGYADILAMYPQQVQSGSIQGNFGQVYSEHYMATTRLKEITVPPLARFSARVGYVKGADGVPGSTVSFGIIDQSGSMVFLKTLDIYYDGALDDIDVELSHLANKKVYFVLRVESRGNGAKDWVVWAEPKVTQKSNM